MTQAMTLLRSPRIILVAVYVTVFGLGSSLSWNIYNLAQNVGRTTTMLSREQLPLLKEISILKNNINRIEPSLYEYYATADRNEYLKRTSESERLIERSWQAIRPEFKGHAASQQLQSDLEGFESSYQKIRAIATQLDGVLGANEIDWDQARSLLTLLTVESQRITGILDELVDIVQHDVFTAGNSAEAGLNKIVSLATAYSLAIFVGALLVGFALNSRQKAELKLVEQARHDAVTGLPNRLSFEEVIARNPGKQFGLMLFGIDQFKRVLGGLGLNAGDHLLQAVAVRIQQAIKTYQLDDCGLFRFEGVEFGLMVKGAENVANLQNIANVIHAAMEAHFFVEGREMFVTLNCGVSLYPIDSQDARNVVRNAGAAMQASREQGKNRLAIYDQDMNTLALDRLALENDLRRAIERNELHLHYQPQLSLTTGEVIGVEALLRWQRNGQTISPAAFIPHAEVSGLIIPIGYWVLQQACLQAKHWQEQGLPTIIVAVNISPRQFLQDDFVGTVQKVLEETGLPAGLLELEITEGAAVQNVEQVIANLVLLKQLGVHLSIDDFGTGYSSLSYLKRFSVDKLKIDQSFIRQMHLSEQDSAIVTVVIELGHQLGLTVIAEGVETMEQLNHLKQLGCDEIQGYYASRPISPQQFEERLAAGLRLNLQTV